MRIRPISLCLFEKNDHVLVQEFWDEEQQHHYYRPPGGGIEFGETALDAIHREMHEELKADLASVQLLTVIENIFEFEGHPKHELAFIFKAEFSDVSLYEKSSFLIEEPHLPDTKAVWKNRTNFINRQHLFYPESILNII